MNKVFAYCVYDRKSEVYNTPYFLINDAVAERQFSIVVNGNEGMVSQYPQDYTLYRLGEFDMLTGKIVAEKGGPVEIKNGHFLKRRSE